MQALRGIFLAAFVAFNIFKANATPISTNATVATDTTCQNTRNDQSFEDLVADGLNRIRSVAHTFEMYSIVGFTQRKCRIFQPDDLIFTTIDVVHRSASESIRISTSVIQQGTWHGPEKGVPAPDTGPLAKWVLSEYRIEVTEAWSILVDNGHPGPWLSLRILKFHNEPDLEDELFSAFQATRTLPQQWYLVGHLSRTVHEYTLLAPGGLGPDKFASSDLTSNLTIASTVATS